MSEGGVSTAEITPNVVNQEEGGYKTEVASLEQPITALVNQLKPNFEEGAYSMIIGDDTSGRLPTLVIHNVADAIYEHQGLPKIPTVFIQSARAIKEEDIKKQVEALKLRYKERPTDKKVLVVTEYINSGWSIKRLTQSLAENGIDCDIATLDAVEPEALYREWGTFSSDTVIFSGTPLSTERTFGHSSPKIWSKPTLTGLKRAAVSEIGVSVLKLGPEIRQDTINAREDIKTLSDRLIGRIYPK